jgi:hypothetical protein
MLLLNDCVPWVPLLAKEDSSLWRNAFRASAKWPNTASGCLRVPQISQLESETNYAVYETIWASLLHENKVRYGKISKIHLLHLFAAPAFTASNCTTLCRSCDSENFRDLFQTFQVFFKLCSSLRSSLFGFGLKFLGVSQELSGSSEPRFFWFWRSLWAVSHWQNHWLNLVGWLNPIQI